jgi:hypothetical protein
MPHMVIQVIYQKPTRAPITHASNVSRGELCQIGIATNIVTIEVINVASQADILSPASSANSSIIGISAANEVNTRLPRGFKGCVNITINNYPKF